MSQRRRLARSTVRPSSSTHGSPQEDEIAFNAGKLLVVFDVFRLVGFVTEPLLEDTPIHAVVGDRRARWLSARRVKSRTGPGHRVPAGLSFTAQRPMQ